MGVRMKLQDYLTKKKETPNAFAGRIGLPAHTVYRYLGTGRIPRPDLMKSIYEATGFAVEPNDFYDFVRVRRKKAAAL